MKYNLNYSEPKLKNYLDKVDEITIDYDPQDTSLVKFLQLYPDKRINIHIADDQDFLTKNRINVFTAIQETYPEITNYVFKLNNFKKEETQKTYDIIRSAGFCYYFSAHISSWDLLNGYLALEPTDVYITNELGFEIKTCASVVHERGAAIRVFPNVAQSAWPWSAGIMHFFIRPEDTKFYEDYVDVYELFGDADHIGSYLHIYQESQQWYGNLNEMIINLHSNIDSRCLLPNFAPRRLDCGKRCLKGRPCQICAAQYELANALSQKNIILNRDKMDIPDEIL